MRRKKISRSILIVIAALLAACLARAMPVGPDAIPPEIAALYSAGRYRQAVEALEAAIERNPQAASLHYWLGRCLFEIRDFNRSISSLDHATELAPGLSAYHDWLGRACGRKADESSHSNMVSALSLARRTHHEFETAVKLDAANIHAQRDLIAFMANAPGSLGGGEGNALAQIRTLSLVDPVEGALALADLYTAEKKFEQANEQYQEILKSMPDHIDAYLEAADYYRDRGDSERMQQAVEAAAKVVPSDRRLSYYRGVALVLEKKDPAVAENELHTYLRSVPDNSEVPAHSSAYEWLGKLYENENKPELAAEQYQAALALDPQNKVLREALKRVQKK